MTKGWGGQSSSNIPAGRALLYGLSEGCGGTVLRRMILHLMSTHFKGKYYVVSRGGGS